MHLTNQVLRDLGAESLNEVQRILGRMVNRTPTVRIARPGEMVFRVAEDLAPQMGVLLGVQGAQAARQLAEILSIRRASSLLAKFVSSSGEILVSPEAFREASLAYDNDLFVTEDMVRVLLIHECVHVLDEDKWSLMGHALRAKTVDENVVWTALMEGHAQFVTERAVIDTPLHAAFESYARATRTPDGRLSEAEQYRAQAEMRWVEFAYDRGHQFFKIACQGARSAESVLAAPPRSHREILHPELYGTRATWPMRTNVDDVWQILAPSLTEYTWRVRPQTEVDFQAFFRRYLHPHEYEDLARRYIGGDLLFVANHAEPGDDIVLCALWEGRDKEWSALSAAAVRRVIDEADARWTVGEGRVVRTESTTLDLGSAGTAAVSRKTRVMKGRHVEVVYGVLPVGEWVIWFIYSAEDVDENECARLVRAAAERLAAGS